MSNDYSVRNPLLSNFVRIRMSGTTKGVKKNATYKEGAALVAASVGGDADAFGGTPRKLFHGHSEELDALIKAYNKKGSVFKAKTAPFEMGSTTTGKDGKAKTQAKGDRLLAIKYLVSGNKGDFWKAMNECEADIVAAKARFRCNLPSILAAIEAETKLGSTFNIDDYPTQEDVDNAFIWTIDGPWPLEDERMLIGLPMEEDWVQAIEQNMREKAEAQARFAQQSVAKEVLQYVQVMANNLGELTKFHDGDAQGRSRAPKIYPSLVTNVREAIEKARIYAIPETSEGTTLLSLADQIEETLEVDRFDSEDFKTSIPLARNTAIKAASLAAAIEELPIFS